MKYRECARVLSQEPLGEDIYSLWLQTERIAGEAVPGQFLSLYCRDGARLLPRPISLCEIRRETGQLRLVYRKVGKGTEEFSKLTAGDMLDVLGPLGNGFPLEHTGRALIVGGGIGGPPLLELARQLPGEKTLVMGYRSQTYLEDELRQAAPLYIATEDGSRGTKGNVLDAIRENALTADVIYACGPLPMLRALKQYAEKEGLEAWLSLEEKMACGIGACLACVCSSTEKDAHSQVKNKRICAEGPVFNAREVNL
ncbi:MAG: dihydroorotate dehydrogenase electron transfer subunit [Lachnospiraceae bacterium]|nr:dihydroorotate dehydrogenase electron transfer subunit [Lachnospiraceae bacterium]